MKMVGSGQEGRTTASMVIIALVIALGVIGAVAITVVIIQQAEAVGCKRSIAANASQGRCIRP